MAEVVVLHLLLARRGAPEERPTRHLEVRPQADHLQVDEEVLLLGAQRGVGMAGVDDAEEAGHALELDLQGALRAQQRRLLVERLAVVAAEDGRYVEDGDLRGLHDEGGAGRIPGGVAAGLEGGPQAAVGKAGGVRLALDQLAPGELRDRPALAVGREEGLVLAGRGARQRQEPVGKMRGPALDGPRAHRVGDLVGDRRIDGLTLDDRRGQRAVGVFREVVPHRLQTEDAAAELGGVEPAGVGTAGCVAHRVCRCGAASDTVAARRQSRRSPRGSAACGGRTRHSWHTGYRLER